MADSMKVRRLTNNLMFGATAVALAISLSVLFLILGYMVFKGASSLSLGFLVHLPAPVGQPGGGIAHAILGSFKLVALASLIGIPVGVLGGIYLAEFAGGRSGPVIRYCADVLNGVPSIVTGIFAYTLVVLPMRHFSGLAGSIALALIMIPLVLRNTEDFIRLVPVSIREAALALGVPHWKTVLRVVVPTAARGILTGAILSVSRIAGETAPLIFTAFGNNFWDKGIMGPMASLPLVIFNYAISPYDDWHRQAWAAGTILLLVVLAGNIIARVALKAPKGAVQ
jgi:phosphate transport system permease protein